MAVRAVFFDFVGTLAFVEPDVGTVYADRARSFGLNLEAAAVARAFARVFPCRPPLAFPPDLSDDARRAAEFAWWRAVVADTLQACGVSLRSSAPKPLNFAFESYFADLYEAFATPAVWRLDPAARSVLETLRQRGLCTGVVSNFDSRLPVLLERLGLGALLDVIVYSSAVGAAKPESAIFHEACRRAGVVPTEALHVGDDPDLDYWGARRAGLRARWRVRGDDSAVPDIPAVDRLRDLTEVLRGLC
jgi:putative hydrolase of the HAD superfamily